jgi:hypothetical protein
MEFTPEKFNQIKGDAEVFYNGIQKVRCPYFQGEIHFNSKGWEHLIFKDWNRTRPINDQFSRLRHIQLAPRVISDSKTLQGVWTTQKFERVKKKDGSWHRMRIRLSRCYWPRCIRPMPPKPQNMMILRYYSFQNNLKTCHDSILTGFHF